MTVVLIKKSLKFILTNCNTAMVTMLKVTKSVALRFYTVTPSKLQQFHNDSRRIVCTYSKINLLSDAASF